MSARYVVVRPACQGDQSRLAIFVADELLLDDVISDSRIAQLLQPLVREGVVRLRAELREAHKGTALRAPTDEQLAAIEDALPHHATAAWRAVREIKRARP